MPLPLPSLDRLTYDQLVAEARASLPALAPSWTDFNAHDPGITLIELLAWLAESGSYRLDNIPDESVRAFLRLVGVELAPAQVSETLLVFATTGTSQTLDKGTLVTTADNALHTTILFQTAASLYISAAQITALVSMATSGETDLTARNTGTTTFLPFGETPKPGDALYLGFNAPLASADTKISLGLWTNHIAQDRITRSRLAAEQKSTTDEMARLCDDQPTASTHWLHHYGAQTQWEYHADNQQWLPLPQLADTTCALTLTGTLTFKVPADHMAGGVPFEQQAGTYFIRCRLAHGGYDCPPQLTFVAINALLARHAVSATPEIFRSNGCATQTFKLAHSSLVLANMRLELSLNSIDQTDWQVAANWDGGGPHSKLVVLDARLGTITFGDGRNGRVPPAGTQIKVGYKTGGGTQGNLPAYQLTQLPTEFNALTVTQPFAAEGGQDAETLNQAKARAATELAKPTRAVTLDDFETLALATPGVPVARVYAIADYHPRMSCIPVSGSVTVVVIPPCPQQRPTPTPALLARVQTYLERRRLVTSEVHVVAPEYFTITVNAELHLNPQANRRALMQRARAALEKYFHALWGGPEGTGWPIGRSVYRSELLALLNALEGVNHVSDLTWQLDDKPANRCGNLELCCTGLLVSGDHKITINQGNACHD
ncbi:MAG: putative baseplate assembly protein [Pseudomonadota bacterium]